ncbi:MAG TPA: NAD-dependent malic enzyme [Acidocella sp.]|nr:NAD-dependent malic enzyme [Acidocella sp.]
MVTETDLTGYALINNPLLNKGTAFDQVERDRFHLNGLLPPHVGTLEVQVERRLQVLRRFETDFQRYAYLRDLQDTNETLFYALLTRHIGEVLPLVYTPTVGEGCQRFSEIWRKPRGVFLSYPNKERIADILADPQYDEVRVIVVTDGERILGLGDQGAGGMGISIGKLALYTACGGIRPEHTLPILLDVGTNNQERLESPLYIGWRHARIEGEAYDEFVEAFVSAVTARWPNILLQWEDFAGRNAGRLLQRYRDRLCTFNDDIQSTAAVAAATLLSALAVTGEKLVDQRIVMLGLGAAGRGIADLLVEICEEDGLSSEQARARFYAIGRHGLLLEDVEGVHDDQRDYVRPRRGVEGWGVSGEVGLLDVVKHARPTVLIGTAGQAGAFDEQVIREMAKHVERPIILPLSNPTSKSEAMPADLMRWTDGKAIIGTGSPFKPVEVNGRQVPIDQTNNAYIFPGMGLGILASGARRVSGAMFMAAAKALAAKSPALQDKNGRLLPPLEALRDVSLAVGIAVANQAFDDGLATVDETQPIEQRLRQMMWVPAYRELTLKKNS